MLTQILSILNCLWILLSSQTLREKTVYYIEFYKKNRPIKASTPGKIHNTLITQLNYMRIRFY